MGFLSGLFKKKAGGTFLGNALRTVASGATGGILGTGKNMIPASGQVQTSAPETFASQAQTILQPIIRPVVNAALSSAQPAMNEAANATTKQWLKKFWWVIALPGGLIIAAIMIMRPKKKRYAYSR